MDFVIIANAWDACIDNPTSKHQVAMALARCGHRVLWINGTGMRRPNLGSSQDRGRIVRKLSQAFHGVAKISASRQQAGDGVGDMWALTPLLVPMPGLAWIRSLNGWICGAAAACWSRRLGLETPVLINYVPVLAEAMSRWQWKTVYHCVDRWDAFDMYESGLMRALDEACCRHADVVITSAADLYERCCGLNDNVHMVRHGVDYDHFVRALQELPRPVDMPAGPIVGFFGLLSEWLDQGLLIRIAEDMPDVDLVLIGKSDVSVAGMSNIRNLHMIGPRPFRDLPDYIAHFQVGIIPFLMNDLTRSVNPIKLREMLAAGCPVVSTALPEVAMYASDEKTRRGVAIARDYDEFIRLLRERIDQPLTTEQRGLLSNSMANETWDAKTAEIVKVI